MSIVIVTENPDLLKAIAHVDWKGFTDRQQNFLSHYIISRDGKAAALHAYICKSDKSAERFASTLLTRWKFRKLLSDIGLIVLTGTKVGQEEALQLLSERLRVTATDAPVFAKLMNLFLELGGVAKNKLNSRPSKGPKHDDMESHDLDKLVRQMEAE